MARRAACGVDIVISPTAQFGCLETIWMFFFVLGQQKAFILLRAYQRFPAMSDLALRISVRLRKQSPFELQKYSGCQLVKNTPN